jgi:molecular chaperone GrpE (heat shock protein)
MPAEWVPQAVAADDTGENARAGADAEADVGPDVFGEQSEPDPADVLGAIAADVSRLGAAAEQYHERARQREGVIDLLRTELEILRRGERRGLLRPALTALTRLHADLLLQARSLGENYTVEQARGLLESFAETVETALADNGVVTYTPEPGAAFDPRRQRKVKSEDTPDLALDGLVAGVRKAGYLDVETDSLLSPAEVTLYKTVKDEQ